MFATLEAKLLGFLAVAALLVSAFGWYTLHIEREEHAKVIAELKASSDKLTKETAAQTAALQERATTAEQSYVQEQLAGAAYRDAHPVGPVRLCVNTNSGAVVPNTASQNPGNAGASPAAGSVQPVPTGNTVGPDIGPILSALAARADQVSATLREYQVRE